MAACEDDARAAWLQSPVEIGTSVVWQRAGKCLVYATATHGRSLIDVSLLFLSQTLGGV